MTGLKFFAWQRFEEVHIFVVELVFFLMLFMWCFPPVREIWRVTPDARFLAVSTLFNSLCPCMVYAGNWAVKSFAWSKCEKKFTFLLLKPHQPPLFLFVYPVKILCNSCWSLTVLIYLNNRQPSAKSWGVDVAQSGRSFILARRAPWGTPEVTGFDRKHCPSNTC